jgi:hypothetical protein
LAAEIPNSLYYKELGVFAKSWFFRVWVRRAFIG